MIPRAPCPQDVPIATRPERASCRRKTRTRAGALCLSGVRLAHAQCLVVGLSRLPSSVGWRPVRKDARDGTHANAVGKACRKCSGRASGRRSRSAEVTASG